MRKNFFILLCLCSTGVFCQDRESLVEKINNEPNLSKKAELWIAIADLESQANQLSNAISAIKESNRLAVLDENQQLLRDNYLKLAQLYYDIGNKDMALIYMRLNKLQSEYLLNLELQRKIVKLEDLHQLEVKALTEQIDSLSKSKTHLEVKLNETEGGLFGLRIITILISLIALALIIFIVLKYYSKQGPENTNSTNPIRNKQYDIQRGSLSTFDHERALENVRNLYYEVHPSETDFKKIFKDSFVFARPQNLVGGSFFWVNSLNNKQLLCLVDCGVGIVGASASILVKNTLDHLVEESNIIAPNMILTLLEQQLSIKLNPKDHEAYPGIRISVLLINQQANELDIATAGQSVYVTKDSAIESILLNVLPLGNTSFKEKFYSSKSIRFSEGQMIFLANNGYKNQLGGPNSKRFGEQGFIRLLESVKNQDEKDQNFVIEKVFKDWKGRREQTEDILILGLTI